MGGMRAAESLRAQGWAEEIVVIGEEKHPPYNRPPLSKEALAGEVRHENVAFTPKPSTADVIWRLGETVKSADLSGHNVTLESGEVISYDGLVVATGVRSRRLPIPGPSDHRFTLRSLDDAVAIRSELRSGARVIVLGAGFIGCEVAATAVKLGCDVTVVAVDPEPMVRPLGEMLGAALRKRHEARGVRFMLRHSITEFTGSEAVVDDGQRLPYDVVVEAVGSICNVEWLNGNGLDLSDGVLCDNALRVVNAEDVVAVGDVARFPHPLFDQIPRRIEHWNIPTESAKRAAKTLIALLNKEVVDETPWMPMPAFWSDQYDLRLQSFGSPGLGPIIKVLEGDLDGEVIVGYYDDERLVGVVGIGMLKELMGYRALIAG